MDEYRVMRVLDYEPAYEMEEFLRLEDAQDYARREYAELIARHGEGEIIIVREYLY